MKISKTLYKRLIFQFKKDLKISFGLTKANNWQTFLYIPKLGHEDNIFLNQDILEIYNDKGGYKLTIPNDNQLLFNYSVDFYSKNKTKPQRRKLYLKRATRRKTPK